MLIRRTTSPHISRILPIRRTVRTNRHMDIRHLDLIPLRLAVEAVVDTGTPIRTRDRGFRTRASLVSICTTPMHITRRHRRLCPVRLGSVEEEDRRTDMTTLLRMALVDMVARALEGEATRKFNRRLSDLRASRLRVRRVQRRNLGMVRRGGRIRSLVLVVAEVEQEVHEDL